MVNKIYELKNKFIQRIENDVASSGIDRVNIANIGALVDIVKDLAEAEKCCMEAEYYKTVVESMNKSGYSGGTGSSTNYMSRSGYGSTRMGHQELMQPIQHALMTANPEERQNILDELKSMM